MAGLYILCYLSEYYQVKFKFIINSLDDFLSRL